MDQQRPFLYLTLFFLGFLIWSTWQQEHAPKPVAPAGQTTQINGQAPLAENGIPNSVPSNIPSNTPAAINNTNTAIPQAGTNQASKDQLIHVKTDVLDLYISTQGGSIIQADLPSHPISLDEKDVAVRIVDKKKGYAAQSGLLSQDANGSDLAPNHYANFAAEKTEYILAEGQNNLQVPLLWKNAQGISVVKTFNFERGKFLVNQTQQVNNQSPNAWTGSEYSQLTHSGATTSGSLLGGSIAYVGPAYYHDKYIKVSFGDIEDEVLKDEVTGGWVAMLQHYFISAWIPQKEHKNNYYSIYDKQKSNYIIGVKSSAKTINSGASDTFNSQFYVGPTDQAKLSAISPGLDLTVDYGIFAFVSKPIFAVMSFINRNIVSNWGWTIILLTLLIKIVFFYPSAISYRSMAKMKKLAPKIKEIGEKHKNDPQAKQKATMDFYRKEKINPLGGCLPMLIQMPVFMGLYWVLQESVELRQAPWILWYKDLSIMDPTFILPLIMGASMWFQQKLNPPVMQDPMQQKIFMYLPIVFTVMFLFFPAGLVLYWVVNSLLSIAQQWFITKKIIGET
ncbi:MAG TPA: membrane protein insertase YidC [Leucothrix sp.]|nr:membrane protein insertase YidC [Leucothrix sp.]